MQTFVDIIVPLPLNNLFTYLLEEEHISKIQVGQRVAVPFGKTKVYTGIVARIHNQPPLHYEAKYVEQILEEYPSVTEHQLKLWKWISDYYMCSFGDVLKASLPSPLLMESESILILEDSFDGETDILNDEEYLIFEALQQKSVLKIQEVIDILDKKTVLPVVHRMVDKGVVQLQQELQQKYSPKLVKYLRLAEAYANESKLTELLEDLDRAEKQKQCVMRFFQLKASTKKPITTKQLSEYASVSSPVVRTLIDKGIIEEYSVREDRISYVEATQAEIVLSEIQQQALQEIQNELADKPTCLLQGVTSSGKTEIYIKLIQSYIEKGKQVLFLIPEIALTTQLIKRLQRYFGEEVIVYHSKYSPNERVEAYRNIRYQEKGKVIVGARSALFLPFTDLGLVIVDESHETSYKQNDPAPRYHGRDTAIVLTHLFGAKTLLGSATPSIESLENVKNGKYGYVKINKRYGNVQPPKIELVDIKDKQFRKRMKGHFSDTLIESIRDNLAEGKQIILFQNRRGYSPILECNSCGHSPQCPNCDVSLTYHKHNNSLRCHYCSYQIAMQVKCLACGSSEVSTKGFGTEQIETEVKELFPEAKVNRMDFDTTRGKYAYENIIASFENQEVDILIGTQMITKGIDFRNVGLVGVMNADGLLNFPDFRSHEKCFQMLVQVAGRAGRTDEQGLVLIQTYQPEHRILQQVTTNDIKTMFKEQLYDRKSYLYPPFYKIIKITLKSKDFNKINESSEWLATYLRQSFGQQVLGPEFPAVARIRNQYHKNIQVKIAPKQSINKSKEVIRKIISSFEAIGAYRSVRVIINVDPQ